MKFGLIYFILLSGSVCADEIARGTVFEDLNGNARYDAGEPGVKDVRVSDGKQVVLTDAKGQYNLSIANETVLFIVKPSGYAVPTNGYRLPQFYYIHQPDGSPEGLRYKGIAPTGDLPKQINFPLKKVVEPTSFEAILFTDPQPMTGAEVDYIRDDVVSELIGTTAKFGMTLGDILYDDLALFPRYLSIVSQIDIPWYNVPGNHEMNYDAPSDKYSLETFKRYFGPPYYAFEYANSYVIVLDNIEYSGTKTDNPLDVRDEGSYIARFTEPQLEWLKNDLQYVSNDKLILVTMHAPLTSYTGDSKSTSVYTGNRRELLQLLSGRKHLYAVAGHTHTTEHHYYGKEEGFDGPGKFHHHILSTVSGSWWSGPLDERGIPVSVQRDGTPNGYHILEVSDTDVKMRYKAAGKAADYQMHIFFDVAYHRYEAEGLRDYRPGAHLDGRMSIDEARAAQIVVNLFDGGPKSSIEFSLNDSSPIKMTKSFRPDPMHRELFLRNKGMSKPWAKSVPSSHIWIADLPRDISVGTHTITVKATDEFGRKHHAHAILEISGSSGNDAGERGW
ncbi:MAG: calcineurin-like phosphoesterase C-terminal domain-containing protein [Calditrichia bacterium]